MPNKRIVHQLSSIERTLCYPKLGFFLCQYEMSKMTLHTNNTMCLGGRLGCPSPGPGCILTINFYSLGKTSKKKNCRFGEIVTIGGEGVRKIIEFSSFTNDEKHGRGGVSE